MSRCTWCLVAAFAFILASPGTSEAVGIGRTCDGIAALRCNPGLFCEHPGGQCRVADGAGRCRKKPAFCTHIYAPVCGCNGQTFGNDCQRRAAGASLRHAGRCRGGR